MISAVIEAVIQNKLLSPTTAGITKVVENEAQSLE